MQSRHVSVALAQLSLVQVVLLMLLVLQQP
jgi:hypothetical protein